MSPIGVYLVVGVCSIALMRYGYARFRANFTKQFLNFIIGGWTLLYAGLVPLASEWFGIADPMYESYYMIGSALLLGSQIVAFVVLNWMRFSNPAVRGNDFGKAYWPTFTIVSVTLCITGTGLLFSDAARYAESLLNLVGLPGVTALYFGAATRPRMVGAALLHVGIFALTVWMGLLLNSKELLVIYIAGPPIFSYFARIRKLSVVRGAVAMVVVGALFLLVLPIVHGTRHQLNWDLLSLQELFQFRAADVGASALSRLLVLDAFARTLANEFSGAPIRPNDPSWTLLGVIFALTPAFFERPDHAQEALLMTGYVTSTIDVNIAVTYLGHLTWSFSIEWLPISAFAFWFVSLKLAQFSVFLRLELAVIYLFSTAYTLLRLETLANIVVARLLLALVALAVVHFVLALLAIRKAVTLTPPVGERLSG